MNARFRRDYLYLIWQQGITSYVIYECFEKSNKTYKFSLTDKLGNKTGIKVTVPRNLNTRGIQIKWIGYEPTGGK